VSEAPVKRIEKITLAPAMGPTDPSITGRHNASDNKLYDVRHATITAVVSSAGLPAFVNAISRTNFMSVIGLDFFPADAWGDLDKGYYYGTDHVVRAVIKVETIWLRGWTEALMPQTFKDALAGSSPDAAAATPAATPRPAARAPEEEAPSVRNNKPKVKSTKRPSTKRGGGGDGG
jgi:ribosomal protein L12E/L44/L45/RPP1/RPP2